MLVTGEEDPLTELPGSIEEVAISAESAATSYQTPESNISQTVDEEPIEAALTSEYNNEVTMDAVISNSIEIDPSEKETKTALDSQTEESFSANKKQADMLDIPVSEEMAYFQKDVIDPDGELVDKEVSDSMTDDSIDKLVRRLDRLPTPSPATPTLGIEAELMEDMRG